MAFLKDLTQKAQRGIQKMETPVFDTKPWVSGPPLTQRKIAMISSAGLLTRDDHRFVGMDSSYREIPVETDAGDILMGHVSTNFDRTGFIQDINVVYPIDRLRGLVDDGTVGAIADTHYSFMGGADPRDMEAHARELAGKLHADGVDAALLIPTCPHCTRAVSVLAHFLEEEGIATTVIGLLRELIERAKPPRALWVPFEMGRPLGAPNAKETQIAVLKAALELLERNDGPGLIEDFPEQSEHQEKVKPSWASPIQTSRTEVSPDNLTDFGQAFSAELDAISAQRFASLSRLGRSSFGLSELSIETIGDLLVSYLTDDRMENPTPIHSPLLTMRFAMDDLKTFYFEAAVSTGPSPESKPLEDWFWTKTVAGQLLIELRDRGLQGADPKFKLVSTNFTMPHSYVISLNLRSVENAPLPGT